MTRDEMDRIDRLTEKVESYHVEVREQITSCKACQEAMDARIDGVKANLAGVARVVYGNGEPGLKGDVQSLKESRGHMRAGIAAAWAALVSIACALLKLFVG